MVRVVCCVLCVVCCMFCVVCCVLYVCMCRKVLSKVESNFSWTHVWTLRFECIIWLPFSEHHYGTFVYALDESIVTSLGNTLFATVVSTLLDNPCIIISAANDETIGIVDQI